MRRDGKIPKNTLKTLSTFTRDVSYFFLIYEFNLCISKKRRYPLTNTKNFYDPLFWQNGKTPYLKIKFKVTKLNVMR